MDYMVVITVLALFQYLWFGLDVARMRHKHGCPSPAMTGHPEFERTNRVHYNTLEQLIIFLPAMWLYGYYVNARWAAALGVVYLIGRFIYRVAYIRDPASRTTGFTLTVVPSVTMLVWVLVVTISGWIW